MARWKGLGVPFRFGSRGFPEPATDLRLLNDSIETILKTFPGERVYRPAFGSFLRRLLFANMGKMSAMQARAEVYRAIETWEPRVVIERVDLTLVDNQIQLSISWTPRVGEERRLTTTLMFGV